jgi:alkaline phosphatase D
VIEFNAPDQTLHPVFEISTSPLSMFYVPIVRTLQQESAALVKRVRKTVQLNADGHESVYVKVNLIPQERVMKYVPIGNYKWCVQPSRKSFFLADIYWHVGVPLRSTHATSTTPSRSWSSWPTDARSTSACSSQRLSARLLTLRALPPSPSLEILGAPVTLKAPSALGTLIPENINKLTQMLDKIGLKPSKWF